jgi:hypothetical protein
MQAETVVYSDDIGVSTLSGSAAIACGKFSVYTNAFISILY